MRTLETGGVLLIRPRRSKQPTDSFPVGMPRRSAGIYRAVPRSTASPGGQRNRQVTPRHARQGRAASEIVSDADSVRCPRHE